MADLGRNFDWDVIYERHYSILQTEKNEIITKIRQELSRELPDCKQKINEIISKYYEHYYKELT